MACLDALMALNPAFFHQLFDACAVGCGGNEFPNSAKAAQLRYYKIFCSEKFDGFLPPIAIPSDMHSSHRMVCAQTSIIYQM